MSVSPTASPAAIGLQYIAANVMRQGYEGQKQVMETLFADAVKPPVQAAAGAGKGMVVDTTA